MLSIDVLSTYAKMQSSSHKLSTPVADKRIWIYTVKIPLFTLTWGVGIICNWRKITCLAILKSCDTTKQLYICIYIYIQYICIYHMIMSVTPGFMFYALIRQRKLSITVHQENQKTNKIFTLLFFWFASKTRENVVFFILHSWSKDIFIFFSLYPQPYECVKHENQGHKHHHVIYIYIYIYIYI